MSLSDRQKSAVLRAIRRTIVDLEEEKYRLEMITLKSRLDLPAKIAGLNLEIELLRGAMKLFWGGTKNEKSDD